MTLRDLLRSLTPFGLIERHRRRFRLSRLGLADIPGNDEAVETCRYDLWPSQLRKSSEPLVLVDVGANAGDFSRAATRLSKVGCVHAFEPQPACRAALQQALAGVPESHVHSVAVGAQSGEIELLCTENSKMASVLAPDPKVASGYVAGDFKIAGKIKVPLVRVDDVIPLGTRVSLMKIDVQGYELEVLEGATRTLENTSALLMEINYVAHYEGGVTFDDLHASIRRRGFRTFAVSAPYAGADGPLWADAVFVRDDNVPRP